MRASLASKEDSHQNGEKHGVGREERKDRKADLMEQFAGTAAFMLPIVIAAAATAATRGSAVKRRLAADSRLFPFRFRRGMRKGSGH